MLLKLHMRVFNKETRFVAPKPIVCRMTANEKNCAEATRKTHRLERSISSAATNSFLGETIAVWQPYSNQKLTHEDAWEIAENLVGFFRTLEEWDRAERADSIRGDDPQK
jgi:hypothetical protein